MPASRSRRETETAVEASEPRCDFSEIPFMCSMLAAHFLCTSAMYTSIWHVSNNNNRSGKLGGINGNASNRLRLLLRARVLMLVL
jgi:hypothetical protein